MALPSKLKDIEIPMDDPFKNDILGMESYASTLKSIVEMYAEDGGVIAINGDWGTGKTTFSKMLKAYLENNNIKTVYFNTWETDYYKDPLVAIIRELKYISHENENFKNLCSSVGMVGLNVTKNLFLSIIKRAVGIDSECMKDIFGSIEDTFLDRIKD